jgi:iron(III) transport system substrate-binding protein
MPGCGTVRSAMNAALGLAAIAVVVALVPAAAAAQDILTYTGADRSQRILEGARKEGTVTLYSSANVVDMNPQIAAFEKKYGIKVRLWRASSQDVARRAINEQRAGRYEADVVETAGSDMEIMTREKALQPFRTPVSETLIPAATRAHRQWIVTRVNLITGAYNSKLIASADAPRRYEDLADPRWKGRLGIEAGNAYWLMQLATIMGEDKAIKLFRNIVSTNGMSVRRGHSLLANLVPTGEVPLALTVYGYRIEQLKREGQPVEILYLPPVLGLPTGAGIVRRGPHPHAAALLADFFLTDGQRIIADRFNVPVNPKVAPIPENLALVDVARFLDDGERWTKLFAEIFTGK